MTYIRRIAENYLSNKLAQYDTVLVEGPRGCGKTTISLKLAGSRLQIPSDSISQSADSTIHNPNWFSGRKPRAIIEWQEYSGLSAVLRNASDPDASGAYLLTQSQRRIGKYAKDDVLPHAGRLRLYPLTLWESGESSGAVSLNEMIDRPDYSVCGESVLSRESLCFAICRGGWPKAQEGSMADRLAVAPDLLQTLTQEIGRGRPAKRKHEIASGVVRAHARHLSEHTRIHSMLEEIQTECGYLAYITYKSYLEALKALFVIEDLPAWKPQTHHWTSVSATCVNSFSDPSFAAAALQLTPSDLMQQADVFRNIFKCLCVRELRVYAQLYGGKVYTYHDRFGISIDCIVQLPTGYYLMVQCAATAADIDRGAEMMLYETQHIDKRNALYPGQHCRRPGILMVLTPQGKAYTRPDGVKVVPVSCLKD